MIRVLNIISGLNNAGTEAVVMNYYRHIDRTEVQFDFLVLDEGPGYYESEILSLGGRIFKIPAFRSDPIECMSKRRKFFKTHKYDIVEIHSPSALRYAYCKLARKSGAKKVIFHIHNCCDKNGFLINYARKQVEKYCDEIVSCSQTAAISVMGRNADKIVPNAIDCDLYGFNIDTRNKVRQHFNIGASEKVIGHVGRFSDQKNPLFLLEAFSQAVKKDGSLKLIMKGFGELESDVRDKINELNVNGSVIIADDKFTAKELYNSFDLFVLPSKYEGLPVVSIEAQVNGLRSVLSKNITPECNISGYVKFEELSTETWKEEFLTDENYLRIPDDVNFINSEYDINYAAKQRQRNYMEINNEAKN